MNRATIAACALVGGLCLGQAALANTTGITGSGNPFSEVQPSLGMNYLIRTNNGVGNVGEVMPMATYVIPGGWAVADGSVIATSQFPDLFAAISNTYGGDGVTTYALPDLRSRVAIGAGQGPGTSNYALGATAGAETMTLAVNQIPSHTHTLPGGGATSATGGGQLYSNMQPSLALNATISPYGIFPGSVPEFPFVGHVQFFAGDTPVGTLPASGQAEVITDYEPLWFLTGTTFGGDGSETFAMPDLRGRTPIGMGQGPGLTNRLLGETPGVESTTLAPSQLPAHNHSLPGDVTGTTGGGQPVDQMQPSLGLSYIIALQGVFPSDGDAGNSTLLSQLALFAGNSAPGGWAFPNGQLLPINQNQALFALIGTTYGGDGQNTFALPDLRGRTVVGAGSAPELSAWSRGQVEGVEHYSLAVSNLAAHSHEYEVPEPAGILIAAMGTILVGLRTIVRKR